MKSKPVVPRARARADVDTAIQYYLTEAGEVVALRFIDSLERLYTLIGETPGSGSPRWAHELGIPGLCSKRIKGFPWLVFFVGQRDHVDVWRVLHSSRDVPGWLLDEEDTAEPD